MKTIMNDHLQYAMSLMTASSITASSLTALILFSLIMTSFTVGCERGGESTTVTLTIAHNALGSGDYGTVGDASFDDEGRVLLEKSGAWVQLQVLQETDMGDETVATATFPEDADAIAGDYVELELLVPADVPVKLEVQAWLYENGAPSFYLSQVAQHPLVLEEGTQHEAEVHMEYTPAGALKLINAGEQEVTISVVDVHAAVVVYHQVLSSTPEITLSALPHQRQLKALLSVDGASSTEVFTLSTESPIYELTIP